MYKSNRVPSQAEAKASAVKRQSLRTLDSRRAEIAEMKALQGPVKAVTPEMARVLAERTGMKARAKAAAGAGFRAETRAFDWAKYAKKIR